MKPLIKKLFLNIRIWDVMASVRSDLSIANSLNTQNRIRKYYKKDSIVLYPPVETERFAKKIENNLVYNNPFFIE
ncbi:Glycosyl transferase, group 1 [sediment metagenome]|uniref:Glycosyl transferase, group 1 n=1 Tax=sediment metagenome TaxID=749907 RepID=D9PKC8_9ZZZZ